MYRVLQTLVCLSVTLWIASSALAFDFTPGDFYTTNFFSGTITQYNSTGAIKGSITPLTGYQSLQGLAFGSDNLLYATVQLSNTLDSFEVVAVDGNGAVMKTYSATGSIYGSVSSGKIAFDNYGNFYVASDNGIFKFTQEKSSGQLISIPGLEYNSVYDIKFLPTGNLLAILDYNLCEITSAGQIVRKITINDPNGLSGDTIIRLVDPGGIEYDPNSISIFVTMRGYSGSLDFTNRLMKIDADSGELLAQKFFNCGDDMFLATDGRLIVGSSEQSPGIFTTNLDYVGSFDGQEQLFVTQCPVPEPASISALLAGIGIYAGLARRRRKILL